MLLSVNLLCFQLAWPALFVAVKNGHERIVEYLVEKGADISYQKRVSYKNATKQILTVHVC